MLQLSDLGSSPKLITDADPAKLELYFAKRLHCPTSFPHVFMMNLLANNFSNFHHKTREIFVTLLENLKDLCYNIHMLANPKQVAAHVAAFKRGTKLTYKKGEYILRPGESPPGVFYIEKGLVKAYKLTKYGEDNLLTIRKEREIFPIIWSVTGQDREIIYQTLVPTVVWRLRRAEYIKFIKELPADALPPFLDIVIEMYRLQSERILNLEYRSVRERTISFLLTMSERFGKRTTSGILINAPLRQQDIASSINSSRESASRALTYLERNKLISLSSPYITLLNKKKLSDYL